MYKFLIFFCLIFPLNGNDNLPTPTPKEDVIISGATIHPITSESFLVIFTLPRARSLDWLKNPILVNLKLLNLLKLSTVRGFIFTLE